MKQKQNAATCGGEQGGICQDEVIKLLAEGMKGYEIRRKLGVSIEYINECRALRKAEKLKKIEILLCRGMSVEKISKTLHTAKSTVRGVAKKTGSRAAGKQGETRNTKMSLCFLCQNAVPDAAGHGCPWSIAFKPVPGWKAERRDIYVSSGSAVESYRVIKCPLYEKDERKRIDAADLKKLAEKLREA